MCPNVKEKNVSNFSLSIKCMHLIIEKFGRIVMNLHIKERMEEGKRKRQRTKKTAINHDEYLRCKDTLMSGLCVS